MTLDKTHESYFTGDRRVAHRQQPALADWRRSSIAAKSLTLEMLSALGDALMVLPALITNTTDSIPLGKIVPVSMWMALPRFGSGACSWATGVAFSPPIHRV